MQINLVNCINTTNTMTWRTQAHLDVLRAQRRRTVSPNGLFRSRRAQFAAWMRQPAGTQLAGRRLRARARRCALLPAGPCRGRAPRGSSRRARSSRCMRSSRALRAGVDQPHPVEPVARARAAALRCRRRRHARRRRTRARPDASDTASRRARAPWPSPAFLPAVRRRVGIAAVGADQPVDHQLQHARRLVPVDRRDDHHAVRRRPALVDLGHPVVGLVERMVRIAAARPVAQRHRRRHAALARIDARGRSPTSAGSDRAGRSSMPPASRLAADAARGGRSSIFRRDTCRRCARAPHDRPARATAWPDRAGAPVRQHAVARREPFDRQLVVGIGKARPAVRVSGALRPSS